MEVHITTLPYSKTVLSEFLSETVSLPSQGKVCVPTSYLTCGNTLSFLLLFLAYIYQGRTKEDAFSFSGHVHDQ